MGDRPVTDVIYVLTALRSQVRAEFDGVVAVADQHVGRLLRAVDAVPRSSSPVTALVEAARPMAADLAAAADQAGDSVEAEVRRLRRLLAGTPEHAAPARDIPEFHTPETGRRPPVLRPSPVAGGPAPASGPPVPGLAPEPELTSGAEYTGTPFTAPAAFSIEGARQGGISDCHLIASLCAVADRTPDLLPTAAPADDVVVVDVPGRRYRLRATLPVDGRTGELAYARSPDRTTLIPYLEKAFAVYGGGYVAIGRGGFPAEALYWLTGRPSYMLPLARAGDDAVTALLTSGHPAVACSRHLEGDDPAAPLARRHELLQAGHAYAVRGVDHDGRVLLHNPWGLRHPRPVPLDVFRELFSRVDWCEHDDDD